MIHGKKKQLGLEEQLDQCIELRYITTVGGNVIHIFYNPKLNLLVVDLCGETGGNEVLRMEINEEALLEHLKE